MTGTASQIEWAEQIKPHVDAEFDRVASAFRAAARQQQGEARTNTETVLVILEDKRRQVMANDQAGYFIRDWRELTDQVRRMIAGDPRYLAIRSSREARPRESGSPPLG